MLYSSLMYPFSLFSGYANCGHILHNSIKLCVLEQTQHDFLRNIFYMLLKIFNIISWGGLLFGHIFA